MKIKAHQTVGLLISDQIGNIKDQGFNVSGYGFGVEYQKKIIMKKQQLLIGHDHPITQFFDRL